jgi:hypothetical protein
VRVTDLIHKESIHQKILYEFVDNFEDEPGEFAIVVFPKEFDEALLEAGIKIEVVFEEKNGRQVYDGVRLVGGGTENPGVRVQIPPHAICSASC